MHPENQQEFDAIVAAIKAQAEAQAKDAIDRERQKIEKESEARVLAALKSVFGL